MKTGRLKFELPLTDEECSPLQVFAPSRSPQAALSTQGRIILSNADDGLNNAIAKRLDLAKAAVGKWRTRFIELRISKEILKPIAVSIHLRWSR